jgi:hypothetical protein
MARARCPQALGDGASGSHGGMPVWPSITGHLAGVALWRGARRQAPGVGCGPAAPRHGGSRGRGGPFWTRVNAMAAAPRHRDGRRRRATHRQEAGCHGGRAQARRVMRQARVGVPRPRRRGPVTTDRRPGDEVAPHRLARQWDGAAPEHVWAGEITARWTAAGGRARSGLVDVSWRPVVG